MIDAVAVTVRGTLDFNVLRSLEIIAQSILEGRCMYARAALCMGLIAASSFVNLLAY